MGNNSKKNKNNNINKSENQGKKIRENITFTKDEIIDIQAEAYYRALKRIEEEKNNNDLWKDKSGRKKLGYILNMFFFPFHMFKGVDIKKRVYDDALVIFVTLAMLIIGIVLWVAGIITIVVSIINKLAILLLIGIISLMLGGVMTVGSQKFSEEKDSNTIYAFSSGILAVVSCIVAVVALIVTIVK